MRNGIKRYMKKPRKAYAIVFEVMVTLALVALYIQLTIYTVNMMNIHRYMTTVLTSTLIEESKWGGVNTNAYKVNNVGDDIITNANRLLQRQGYSNANTFNAKVTGGPNCINKSNDVVYTNITYKYPDFPMLVTWMKGKQVNITLEMESIMRPGLLLCS